MSDEPALRRAFEALRSAERRGVPPLERLLRPPTAPRRARAFQAVAAGMTLIAAATLLIDRGSGEARSRRALERWRRLAVASWGAPTRSLLETPDRALLGGALPLPTRALAERGPREPRRNGS